MKSNRIIYTKKTKPINSNIDLHSKLEFGKYKGKKPIDIINEGDNQYLIWLFQNDITKQFSEELLRILNYGNI